MRIGKFAEEFDVKKSTIRYYTDIKLLYPILNKRGYDYDKRCYDDMLEIIEYKELGFSIDEIKKIINYKRSVKVFLKDEQDNIIRLLDKKKEYLINEYENIQNKIKTIDKKKVGLLNTKEYVARGLTLESISLLKCTKCDSNISITNSVITENGILDGQMYCKRCGKIGKILGGIVNTRHSNDIELPKIRNTKINNQWQEVYKLVFMVENVLNEDKEFWDNGDIYLFNGVDVMLISISLLEHLNKDKIFIFTDKSMKSLQNLKSKIDRLQIKGSLMYICIEDGIPLKPVANRLIDLYGILMNAFYTGEKTLNLEAIIEGVTRDFEYMCINIVFDSSYEDVEGIDLSYFDVSKVYGILNRCKINIIDEKVIIDKQQFNLHIPIDINDDVTFSIRYNKGKLQDS